MSDLTMFDINTWATIKIWADYIIPITFIVLVALYFSIEILIHKINIWRVSRIHHNIKWEYKNLCWSAGYCTHCGNKIFDKKTFSDEGSISEIHLTENSFKKCIQEEGKR